MNNLQKLLLVLAGACVIGAGAWLFLGGNPDNGGVVGFTADELEAVDEDLGEIIGAEAEAPEEERLSTRVVDDRTGIGPAGGEPEARPTLVLEGRVVDGKGQPVAAAEVSLYMRRSLSTLFADGGFRRRGRRGGGEDWRERFRLRKVAKSVRTAADGKFTFQGPAFKESTLEVGVAHTEFAPKVARREWAEKDGKLKVADIVLERGGLAFGRVTRREGTPVEGAEVRYVRSDRGRGGRGRGGRGRNDSRTIEELIPVAKTDARGQFELPNLPAGRFRLEVTAPKHLQSGTRTLEMEPGAKVDCGQILIELGAELRGVVRDQQGSPVPGARIEAVASRQALFGNRERGRGPGGERANRDPDQERRDREAMMRRFGRLAAAPRTTKTDNSGEFFLDSLPPDGVRLTVKHPKFIDEEMDPVKPAETPAVTIELYRRIAVAGTVIDARTNKPVTLYGIEARTVFDFGRGRGFGGDRGRGGRADRRRGERGNRDAGRGNREGRGGGGRGERGRRNTNQPAAEAPQGPSERELARQREEAYRKQRLGPSGEVPRDPPEPGPHPEGKFLIEGLQPGRFVFDVGAPGYAKIAAGPLELERGEKMATITIRIEPGVSLAGRVLAKKSGEPIAGARVQLFLPPLQQPNRDSGGLDFRRFFGGGRNNGLRIAEARTASDGSYAIEGLRAGGYRLVTSAGEYTSNTVERLMLSPGQEVRDYRIELASGARIFGTVRNLGDKDARVSVRHKDGARESTRVEKDGSYEIKGLVAGPWFISLEITGDEDFRRRGAAMFAEMNREPDVVLAEGADVRFDLDASTEHLATVKGRVFRNGEPAQGFEVTLSLKQAPAAAGNGNDVARMMRRVSGRFLRDGTNEDGSFEITSVPPGSYTIEVRSRGGRRGGGRGGRGGGGSPVLRQDVVLAKGQVYEQTFTVQVGELELNVTLPDGKPVESARVELVLASEAGDKAPEEWRDLASRVSARVRNGGAKLGNLPVGPWRWSLTGDGLISTSGNLYVGAGATPARENLEAKVEEKKAAEKKQG